MSPSFGEGIGSGLLLLGAGLAGVVTVVAFVVIGAFGVVVGREQPAATAATITRTPARVPALRRISRPYNRSRPLPTFSRSAIDVPSPGRDNRRMGRQQRDVAMDLGPSSGAGGLAALAARADSLRREWASHHLALRVGADGAVRARTVLPSRYHAYPHLRGRLTTDGGVLTLTATIVESFAEVVVPWMYAVVATFCAVMTVVPIVNGDPTPGAYVLGPAAIAFGGFAWSFVRLRSRVFAVDAQRITEQVRSTLRDSAGRVHAAAPGR